MKSNTIKINPTTQCTKCSKRARRGDHREGKLLKERHEQNMSNKVKMMVTLEK